jgi:hypothetical protein
MCRCFYASRCSMLTHMYKQVRIQLITYHIIRHTTTVHEGSGGGGDSEAGATVANGGSLWASALQASVLQVTLDNMGEGSKTTQKMIMQYLDSPLYA